MCPAAGGDPERVMSDERNQSDVRGLEELWTRFVAREPLGAEERASLAAALERDEVLRRPAAARSPVRRRPARGRGDRARSGGGHRRGEGAGHRGRPHRGGRGGRAEAARGAGRPGFGVGAGRGASSTGAGVAGRRGRRPLRGRGRALLLSGRGGIPRRRPARSRSRTPRAILPCGSVRRVPGARDLPRRSARTPILARLEAIEGPAYRHGADGTVRLAPAPAVGTARRRALGAAPPRRPLDLAPVTGSRPRARPPAPDCRPGRHSRRARGRRGRGPRGRPARGSDFRLARPGHVGRRAPGGPGLVLASPHAIVTGEASVRLDVGATVTRVEVTQGRARVSGLGVQRGTTCRGPARAGQRRRAAAGARLGRGEALLLTGPDDTKEPVPPGAAPQRGAPQAPPRAARLPGHGLEPAR